ncbi:RNA polymerase sigma factor [Nocardia nepalensis]|uniref:RNA polymerase sigma factor n=1 Tax=Nocardia nepalensis TaxID=3375448 RepID=UPI003B67409F
MDHRVEGPAGSRDPAQRFSRLTNMSVEDAAVIVYSEALRLNRGDRAAAEVISQETWVRIIDRVQSGAQSDTITYPNAWLRRVVHRVHIDEGRKSNSAKARPAIPLKPLSAVPNGAAPADPGRGPDELTAATDLGRRLRRAITELPLEQRQVVELVLHGHSFAELAELLGIPLGTAKTRFRAAATNLRAVPGLAVE